MPEYLDDPSVLTKDKLKSELLAHNVELPSGNPTKDVYVQLYLKNLTAQNKKHVTATTLDAFSSDEELPPPVVSNRSRSSGRKATRKTDKVRPDELDVTMLTDEGLRDELLKHGVDVGPVVASTRKLYEKKLQKLLDDGPAQPPLPQLVLTEIEVNHNGNSESDLYSDKEDEVTAAPEPEPVPEPEPAPVVERPVRSRGKTPVTTRTRSSQHHTREQLMDEEDDDDDEEPVLQVKRRSRRLSNRTSLSQQIVPEDLRPELTDPIQLKSNRNIHHKSDSPAQAERHSTSSRRVQVHREELGLNLSKHSKNSSHKPDAVLNTALLQSKRVPEEQSQLPAAKPSFPLVPLTRVDPVTFSPMCNISPIKSQESYWSVSDQTASKPSGVSAAGEERAPSGTLLHKRRQPKISSFLSARGPVKTHSYTPTLSGDVLERQVEKITASDQNPKVEENDVLKELFPNDMNSPTGISATCRRPIRGAAGRPLKSSDLWNNENCLFSPKTTTKTSISSSSYTESRTVNRVTSLPPSTPSTAFTSSTSTSSFTTSSRLLSAAPPAGQTKASRRSMSLWIKLFLLAIVAVFLFLVYQTMETNSINPFGTGTEVTSGSTA
ncbi:LOW QUALITY PROTEIN: lamina-associated polypeptide 2, isoforms beta/delta/epsilon/gamma-like [Lates calcarifer]|uniref:LOW QUALITY PROTEIN: lamina-associated polypeptide 2, isoforms beta/delta/epsilon/gamma-like n=2 Tax=Lates calcarifer TaxID=8187 RepID=A0AAJ7QCN1_LATCA|nr:LOW QUALITY PROTEIN: lamina-associated polypeptide 2, isoforms beta/delta/epsilon/gamma-like [Lates calcarifer]